ncbi:MAG: DUF4349 domain-containing protein, partial [Candidatus Kaiserbacteria bacterium]|nr:DUF4349 domain-containing protein [Candidatus Kaiserbacteria bacterium]
MTDGQYVPKRFRPKRVSWLTIVLALLAVGTFFAISGQGRGYPIPIMGGVGYSGSAETVPPSPAGAPMMDTGASNVSYKDGMMVPDRYPYPYPYPNPDVPVTDTREFLKVYYNASMQTRDVQGLTRRVVTTVRGYDGRIDNESSSQQYGYVSFVVPQSKFEAFRDELEGLVNSRFLKVNISSQNLLPQKQSIEEQQKQADSALADYKTARQQVVAAHASAVKSLQSQIDTYTQMLASLRAQVQSPQVQAQIQDISNSLVSLNQQITNENSSYASQLKNADA